MSVDTSNPSFFPNISSLPSEGFIRSKDLVIYLPFSSATLWRKSKNGSFPKPYKLSQKITAWKCEEINQWFERLGKGV